MIRAPYDAVFTPVITNQLNMERRKIINLNLRKKRAYPINDKKNNRKDEISSKPKKAKLSQDQDSTKANTLKTIKTTKKTNTKHRKTKTPNDPKQAEVIQWNICGLRGRLPEFQLITNEYNPKIIALQETMFDDTKYYDKLNGSKYKWYLKPGPVKIRNGVAIAIDKNIPHSEIDLKTDLQAIACRTTGENATTYVSIYIPPRKMTPKNLKSKLQDLIDQLPKPFILMGDFNAHRINWGSFKDDRWGNTMLEIINDNNLTLMNTGSSTKISITYSCLSAVDLTIVSNDIKQKLNWSVDIDNRGSDHFPIILRHNIKEPIRKKKPNWILQKADWDLFQLLLINKLPIERKFKIEEITTAITEAANKSIPKTKGTLKKRKPPWWNNKIEKVVNKRRKALKKLLKHKHNDNRKILIKKLARANRIARKKIKKAKKDSWDLFLKEINVDSDPAELWAKINALNNKKKKEEISFTDGANIINDQKEITNLLADYFFEQSATKNYSPSFQKIKEDHEKVPYKINDNDSSKTKIFNKDFSMKELNLALKNADGKAAGPDSISYEILRKLPMETKNILLTEYNNIWNNGPIPPEWKKSTVVPIPKGGLDKHKVTNYRPISLLNCMGKILEKMVNLRLITELEENNRLNANQFAFRPGKSTDEYFSDLEQLLSEPLSKSKHTECALLDISKAYDRAWRRPILDKLTEWDINGNMQRYINDFLTDREFQVEIGTTKSETKIQENGIPQGAVISVTLFLIAMNSVFDQVKNIHKNRVKILVYADDIIIVVIGQVKKKLRALLQKYVNKITKWANDIGFTIAPQKSKIIHICKETKHKRLSNIIIDGIDVPTVKYAKLLGITIDSRLTFNQHVVELRKDLINRCNLIKAICGRSDGADRTTLLRIFEAIVVSKIMYGAHFYFRGNEKQLKRIKPLYNQTIRRITGAFRTCPVASILAETGVLPLVDRIKLQTIKKAINWIEHKENTITETSPLITRANDYCEELTGQTIPEIATSSVKDRRKWYEKGPTIDWSIKNKIKAGCNERVAKQTFLETKNKYPNHQKIYTDGSLADNSVGCGITDLETNISVKLNEMCSIFSAEAMAIDLAIYFLASKDQESIIFSDSASCLAAIEEGNHNHPWIQEIEIDSKNYNITLCWIPGHTGIKGNELADKLANKGRQQSNENPHVPAHDAIKWINKETLKQYDYKWRSNNSSFLRMTKPTTYKWKDRKSVEEQKVLTRIRTGHTWLSHKHLIKKTDPPKCKFCNDELTADHIIRECRGYTNERIKYQTDSLNIYNNDETNENNLINFLKETKTFYEM